MNSFTGRVYRGRNLGIRNCKQRENNPSHLSLLNQQGVRLKQTDALVSKTTAFTEETPPLFEDQHQ